ncbi:hypothetical protein [Endozoicomonas sp. ONNA1]|uniref:hypothetical protein n=1 Tax=Endozoicomonas sp. ONNA1 TaxID=2828740 RepID=UPI0021477AA3|nr:hypothetical protein [Endozoicomonas sp. ONNA1]
MGSTTVYTTLDNAESATIVKSVMDVLLVNNNKETIHKLHGIKNLIRGIYKGTMEYYRDVNWFIEKRNIHICFQKSVENLEPIARFVFDEVCLVIDKNEQGLLRCWVLGKYRFFKRDRFYVKHNIDPRIEVSLSNLKSDGALVPAIKRCLHRQNIDFLEIDSKLMKHEGDNLSIDGVDIGAGIWLFRSATASLFKLKEKESLFDKQWIVFHTQTTEN